MWIRWPERATIEKIDYSIYNKDDLEGLIEGCKHPFALASYLVSLNMTLKTRRDVSNLRLGLTVRPPSPRYTPQAPSNRNAYKHLPENIGRKLCTYPEYKVQAIFGTGSGFTKLGRMD